MSSAQEFTAQLNRFQDKVNLDISKFRRMLTLKLKDKIEMRTPVDTGRLRSSWAVTDGQPSTYLPAEGIGGSLGPVEATFQDPFQVSFITSNLPYVIPVEFGHSQQAPMGMVRISIAELITELEISFGEL